MDECSVGWKKVPYSCHCGGNEAYQATWTTGPNKGSVSLILGCVCHHPQPTMMEVVEVFQNYFRIDDRTTAVGRQFDVRA